MKVGGCWATRSAGAVLTLAGLVFAAMPSAVQAGAAPAIVGRVTITEEGVLRGAVGARVFVGKDLDISVGTTGTDRLTGGALYAEAAAGDNGTFTIPLPPGGYAVAAWMRGCVPVSPETGVNATSPGTVTLQLSKDTGPGCTGRHLQLAILAPRKTPAGGLAPPLTGINGRVTLFEEGVQKTGANMPVYIGRLGYDIGMSGTDTLFGELMATVRTDDQGLFAAPQLPPGNYDVTTWRQGFTPHTEPAVKAPGTSVELILGKARGAPAHLILLFKTKQKEPLPVPKPPAFGIAGLVTASKEGVWTPEGNVTVYVGQGLGYKDMGVGAADTLFGRALFRTVKTNAKGQFAVRVPPGTYDVAAWAQGFTPHTVNVPAPGGVALLQLSKAGTPAHMTLEVQAPPKVLAGSSPFDGVWKDTIRKHEGCQSRGDGCKVYKSDVTCTTGPNGGTTVTWDAGARVGQGKATDRTLTFTFDVVQGVAQGSARFVLDEDGLGFQGTFSHKAGHQGPWTAANQVEWTGGGEETLGRKDEFHPTTKTDLDLHVVLNWSRPCDVDLHVAEPDGSECWYKNRNTKNGGNLDRDDQQGTGPENYTLGKTVLQGEYKIGVCFYREKGTPGPVTATVRIYRDYQRPNEKLIDTFSVTMQKADTSRVYPVASVFLPDFRVVPK